MEGRSLLMAEDTSESLDGKTRRSHVRELLWVSWECVNRSGNDLALNPRPPTDLCVRAHLKLSAVVAQRCPETPSILMYIIGSEAVHTSARPR